MNKREIDVLNIIAGAEGKPMTSADIVNEMRSLTQSTVIAVLRKLLSENLVEVSGMKHSGKVLARTYTVTQNSKDSVIKYFVEELETMKNIVTVEDIAAAVESREKSDESN